MTDFWDQWDCQAREKAEKAGFDPNQPRDYRGRWTPSGHFHSPKADLPEGYEERDGAVVISSNPPFKTLTEAGDWVKRKIAKDVYLGQAYGEAEGSVEKQLAMCNTVLDSLRSVVKEAPLKHRIEGFIIYASMASSSGQYQYINPSEPSPRDKGLPILQVDCGPEGMTRLPSKQEQQRQAIERGLEQIEKQKELITALEKRLEVAKKIGFIPEPGDIVIKSYDMLVDVLGHKKEWKNKLVAQVNQLRRGDTLPDSSMKSLATTAGSAAVHEYGHAWHDDHQKEVEKYFGSDFKFIPDHTHVGARSKVDAKVREWAPTEYGRKNFAECFAENFTLYMAGAIDTIDPFVLKFFDKQFPRLDWGHRKRKEIYA